MPLNQPPVEPALTPDDARKPAPEPAPVSAHEPLIQRFSPLPTGSRVGDMAIQSVLGAGEFGITYIAVADSNNRRFVIKEYLPRAIAFRDGLTVRVSSANTPTFTTGLDRFLNDARALAKVRHAAVIAVLSVFEAHGTGYIVMPHELGRDLSVWHHELRRAPTQAELDKLVEPLLDGLSELHTKGILHLDIQPANIIVRDSGSPLLLDFGTSRAALRRRLHVEPPPATRAYMAAELLTGDPTHIGARSDIYALAAVLYHLATGTPPVEAIHRLTSDGLPSVADTARGKFRSGFLGAVDDGLRPQLPDRPLDVRSWQDDLLRPEGTAAKPAPSISREAEKTGPEATAADANDDFGVQPRWIDQPALQPILFGAAGAVCGAVAGALGSIVVASVVWSGCASDSCVAPLLPYATAIGTLVGLIAGARYGRQSAGEAMPNADTQSGD